MKAKILILSLICFFIFTYCNSPADPEIEKALNPGNPGNPGLPVIASFTATHQQSTWQDYEPNAWWNSYFILSWSVTDATTISIDQGIGEVEAVDTKTVQIPSTVAMTTFILTATNGEGQITDSCVAEHPAHTVLEITTIPEVPVFYYYSGFDKSESTFTYVFTETNGVGGYFQASLSFDSGACSFPIDQQTFEPFGTLSILHNACAKSRPTIMTIWLEGWDNNKYEIRMQIHIPVIVEN